MLDYIDIEPQMRGQWEGFIASETGVNPNLDGKSRGKNGECPICGGNDRAHFREHDGRVFLFCRGGCGNTNSTWGNDTCSTPEYICMTLGGYDFPTLVERCADWLNIPHEKPKPRANKPIRTSSTPANLAQSSKDKPFYKSPEDYEKAQQDSVSKTADKERVEHESQDNNQSNRPKFVNVNDVVALSEAVAWHRIGYCARNAVTGSEGEFLAIKRVEHYNLIVPLFLDTKRRVVMTGAVEIDVEGRVVKYGSCGGAYATLDGDKSMRVFCTDYATALRINRESGAKCYYSPSPSSFKKTDANYCYINSCDSDVMDKATAFYGQSVDYIIPSAWIKGFFDEQSYRANSLLTDKLKGYRIMSYDECQEYIKEFEDGEVNA